MNLDKINQDKAKKDDSNLGDINLDSVNDLDPNDLDDYVINDIEQTKQEVNLDPLYTQDEPGILTDNIGQDLKSINLNKVESKKETLGQRFEQPLIRSSRKRTLGEIQQKMKDRPNIGQDLGSVY